MCITKGSNVATHALKALLDPRTWDTGAFPSLYDALKNTAETLYGGGSSEADQARYEAVLLIHRSLFKGRLSRDSPDDDILIWEAAYNREYVGDIVILAMDLGVIEKWT